MGQRRYPDIREKISKTVVFPGRYDAPPGLPVGFTPLDLGYHSNPRIKAYPSNIDSWSDTHLIAGSCRWLEIFPNDPESRFGTWTGRARPGTQDPISVSNRITSPRSYVHPRKVVVWLARFYMVARKDWQINTFVTNITHDGFILHTATWGDSTVYTGIASWVAYPATKLGISSGHFSTTHIDPRAINQPTHSGYSTLGDGTFQHPPRVIVALDTFQLGRNKVMRLVGKTRSVGTGGIEWCLETWKGSTLYSAGASYIALD